MEVDDGQVVGLGVGDVVVDGGEEEDGAVSHVGPFVEWVKQETDCAAMTITDEFPPGLAV